MDDKKLYNRALQCRLFKGIAAFLLFFIPLAVFAGVFFFVKSFRYSLEIQLTFYIFSAICLALSAVVPYVRHRVYSYSFESGCLEIKKGTFRKVKKRVPLSSVVRTELHAGPFERMFSVSGLNIYTASARHSIPYLSREKATELMRSILSDAHAIS